MQKDIGYVIVHMFVEKVGVWSQGPHALFGNCIAATTERCEVEESDELIEAIEAVPIQERARNYVIELGSTWGATAANEMLRRAKIDAFRSHIDVSWPIVHAAMIAYTREGHAPLVKQEEPR